MFNNIMKSFLILLLALSSIYVYADDNTNQADALYAKGIQLYNAGKYDEAAKAFISCNDINQALGRKFPYVSYNTAEWISSCYFKMGDLQTARNYSGDYRLKPVDHRLTVYSDSLSLLANKYLEKGNYELAYEKAIQCADFERKLLGDNHYYYANSLYFSGTCLVAMDEYDKALPILKKSVDIWLATDKDQANLPEIFGMYVTCCSSREKVTISDIMYCDSIVSLYNYDVDKQEKMDINADMIYNDAAEFYDSINEYRTALRYAKKFANYAQLTPEDYNQNMIAYTSLQKIYEHLGEEDSCLYINQQLLKYTLSIKGEFSEEYYTFACGLVWQYDHRGNYNKAIEVAKEMPEVAEHLYGKNSEEYYRQIASIGFLYDKLLDYKSSREYYEEAFRISEKKYGVNSKRYAEAGICLVRSYALQGDYLTAISILESVKTHYEKRDITYADLLRNLADYYRVCDYDTLKILSIHNEALDIATQNYGNGSLYLYPYYRSLATDYIYSGNYPKSLQYYQKVINLTAKNNFYEDNSLYFYMATIAANMGDNKLLKEYANKWFPYFIKKEVLDLFHMTEKQQKMVWLNNGPSKFMSFLWALLSKGDSNIVELAYNMALFSKSILSTSQINFKELLLETDNKELLDKYSSIQQLKNEALQDSHTRESNELLQLKIENEEQKLIDQVSANSNTKLFDMPDWHKVQENLTNNDIAVEFLISDLTVNPLLGALVLRKGWASPRLVYLGEKKELDLFLKNGINKTYSNSQLYNFVWSPIIKEAQAMDGESIYFSPEGIFAQLSVENLVGPDGILIGDKYKMLRVLSTNSLVNKFNLPKACTAALYGGIDYGNSLDEINTSTKREVDDEFSQILTKYRSSDRGSLQYLPWTLKEVDAIDNIMTSTKSRTISIQKYVGSKGSEESFKKMSGMAPDIIHIATHGFYVDKLANETTASNPVDDVSNKPKAYDFSMLRSGLMFAGAQKTLSGGPKISGEDGILTSAEISNLDLANTKLVVLSACQTGQGNVVVDGIAGLQRGFKNAGVKSIMMSLWKVDDAATQLLMTEFYKNLTQGTSMVQSLRSAQKYVREYEQDGEKIFADPEYWAGFVLLDAIE